MKISLLITTCITSLLLTGYAFSQSYKVTDLGSIEGPSTATAINDSGEVQVVGYSYTAANAALHAFLWSKTAGMTDLGTLGGSNSYAAGINDVAQVVGWSYPPSSDTTAHAFLWTASAGMVDLGTLGGNSSFSQSINDAGYVVGYSLLSDNSTAHAILWTAAKGMQDLNAKIPPHTGWVLMYASAINSVGQIAGSGTINGQTHAFLLTPIGS